MNFPGNLTRPGLRVLGLDFLRIYICKLFTHMWLSLFRPPPVRVAPAACCRWGMMNYVLQRRQSSCTGGQAARGTRD